MANNLPVLDSFGRVPAYLQVAAALRRRIENGQWKPLEKISTLDELEAEFGVSRVTISKAIEILEEERLLQRQQGRGTFVLSTSVEKHALALEPTWEGMIRAIEQHTPQFIPSASPPLFPVLGAHEATLAEEYVFLRSIQKKDGTPYSLVSVHLAKNVFESRREAFMKKTALSVLAGIKEVKIRKAYQTLEVQTAEKDVADLLRISLSAPTVGCRCVVIDANGVAIYVAEIIYRGDFVKLSMNLISA